MIAVMASERISSPGLGTAWPAGNTLRTDVSPTGQSASSTLAEPASTSVRERFAVRLNNPATIPCRRSASTRQVLRSRESSMARFTAMVVFPSDGNDDVISSTCGGQSGWDKRTEVCNARKASDSADCGLSNRKVGGRLNTALDLRGNGWTRRLLLPINGTRETRDMPSQFLTSSGVWILVLKLSRMNATAMPPQIPMRT